MPIEQMKTRAAELAARLTAGETLSEEEISELRDVTSKIETHNRNAKLAADAVAAANSGTSVSTEDVNGRVAEEDLTARAAKGVVEYAGRKGSGKVELASRATSTTDLQVLPTQKYVPIVDLPTPLTDVVNHETVSTTAVQFVTEDFVLGADVVAEGATRPETTVEFTQVTAALETVSNWTAVTKQAAADFGRVTSLITNRIYRGIINKVEALIATVITSAPTSGAGAIQTNVYASTGSPLDLLSSIREGQAQALALGYVPNAVLMNPLDRAAADVAILRQTLTGAQVHDAFWDLKIVTSPLVAAGDAYVGDFKTAVTIYDRGDTTLAMTDSHADNFLKGVLTLMGDVRVLPYMIVPKAIVKCTVD